ncbi:MAG TPA: YfiR family protein [Blastocatellia bacterium]|nr:YfiR family protein [Blastocatellia bacterium]
MICFISLLATGASGQGSREYDLKAVFLYNFTQFVEWPSKAFPNSSAPIIIGVLGADPFGRSLVETVQGETVRNRRLVVEHYSRVEEIKTCHVLFISQSEAGQLDRILSNLKGRSILTVGETPDFTQRGGVIGFVTEKNKIRLRINLAAARAAELTISSKLLRVAETE